MSHRQHELWTQAQIGYQGLCKVFGRVVSIIDVPFKLVSDLNSAHPYIDLYGFNVFQWYLHHSAVIVFRVWIDKLSLRHPFLRLLVHKQLSTVIHKFFPGYLGRINFISLEVLDLSLHLLYDICFLPCRQIVFFHKNLSKRLYCQVRFILVPEKNFFQPFTVYLQVEFYRY